MKPLRILTVVGVGLLIMPLAILTDALHQLFPKWKFLSSARQGGIDITVKMQKWAELPIDFR